MKENHSQMTEEQIVSEYLRHSQTCIAKNKQQLLIHARAPKGFFFVNDVLFFTDEKYSLLLNSCLQKITKKKGFKASQISEAEIINLLQKTAAKQASTGKDLSKDFLKELSKLATQEIIYIVPNHVVRLNNITAFRIGDVECVKFEKIKRKFKSFKRKDVSFVTSTELLGFKSINSEIKIFMHPDCFQIKLNCSPDKSTSEAQWAADVALSILRLFYMRWSSQLKLAGFYPYIGESDRCAFQKNNKGNGHIKILSDMTFVTDGGYETHPYIINDAVKKHFVKSGFSRIAKKIFDSQPEFVGGSLKRALGWMTKARCSDDLASRFLLFFTALEALLTSSNQDAPVTDTIARNVSVLLAFPKNRHTVHSRVKKLYTTRSKLVHSGEREVSEYECKLLQFYTERSCLEIIKYGLDKKHSDFLQDLKIAGFGSNWPLKIKKPVQ